MWATDFLTSSLARGWFMSLARKGIAALGVWLIARGALSNEQMNDWLGSGLFIASVVWGLWQELLHQQKHAAEAASNMGAS